MAEFQSEEAATHSGDTAPPRGSVPSFIPWGVATQTTLLGQPRIALICRDSASLDSPFERG